jgi:hypothetical protein
MGREFEMYDVTAITLFRNDTKISAFNFILQELEQRAPTLPKTPHWRLSAHDVVRFFAFGWNFFSVDGLAFLEFFLHMTRFLPSDRKSKFRS